MLSLAEVWPSHFDQSWLDRITCLNGDSTQVMAAWVKKGLPRVDLAFIDGGHRYRVVKHDFYSVLSVASPRFQVLSDDYVEKESFGVRKFVDDEVAPLFELEALLAESSESEGAHFGTDTPRPCMALLDSERTRIDWTRLLPPGEIEETLRRMRREAKLHRTVSGFKDIARPLARALRIR